MDDSEIPPNLKEMAQEAQKYYDFYEPLAQENHKRRLQREQTKSEDPKDVEEMEVIDKGRKLIVKKDGKIVERTQEKDKTVDKNVFDANESQDGRLFGLSMDTFATYPFANEKYLAGYRESMKLMGKEWTDEEWGKHSKKLVDTGQRKALGGLVSVGGDSSSEFTLKHFPKALDKMAEVSKDRSVYREIFDKGAKQPNLPKLKERLDMFPTVKSTPSKQQEHAIAI
jgi:hypothetical protein